MITVIQKILIGALVAVAMSGCRSISGKNTQQTAIPADSSTAQKQADHVASNDPPEVPEHIQKKLQIQGISSPSTDVVIRPTEKGMVQEYRANGILYAIKVVPEVGVPYYLVSVDHQGNFARADQPRMLVPSWKILEWK